MKTLVVIILSMLWLGLSGQSAVLAATPAKGDFIPLSVGNRWIYESSEGTPRSCARNVGSHRAGRTDVCCACHPTVYDDQ